jgi:hypothetical protein
MRVANQSRAVPPGADSFRGVQRGPGRARAHVDRGVLPHNAFGGGHTSDVEAIHPRQRRWCGSVQMALRRSFALGFGRCSETVSRKNLGQHRSRSRRNPTHSTVLSGTARVGVTSEHALQRVESQLLDAEEVRGSNPLAPTSKLTRQQRFTMIRQQRIIRRGNREPRGRASHGQASRNQWTAAVDI